jgi:ribose transport system permease protein
MSVSDTIARWRYRAVPDHLLGEILTKRWIDNAIPLLILVAVVITFGSVIPDFYSASNIAILLRQWGEFSLLVLALTTVIVAGGIDLSVGSTFALGNIVALALLNVAGWPLPAVIAATLAACATVGLVNGLLIGYLRLRAFLTTLVTLIIVRAIVDVLLLNYSVRIAASFVDSDAWYFLGEGSILGIPFSVWVAAVVAVTLHLVLSRSRIGWHVLAIGG